MTSPPPLPEGKENIALTSQLKRCGGKEGKGAQRFSTYGSRTKCGSTRLSERVAGLTASADKIISSEDVKKRVATQKKLRTSELDAYGPFFEWGKKGGKGNFSLPPVEGIGGLAWLQLLLCGGKGGGGKRIAGSSRQKYSISGGILLLGQKFRRGRWRKEEKKTSEDEKRHQRLLVQKSFFFFFLSLSLSLAFQSTFPTTTPNQQRP